MTSKETQKSDIQINEHLKDVSNTFNHYLIYVVSNSISIKCDTKTCDVMNKKSMYVQPVTVFEVVDKKPAKQNHLRT